MSLADLIKGRPTPPANATFANPANEAKRARGISKLTITPANANSAKAANRDDEGARNRAAFPVATAFIDDMRAAFGDVRVVYVAEGGREVGRRLLPHEVGVPFSRTETDSMPTEGCSCVACERLRKPPTKTELKRRQREPGAQFGLDAHRGWKQPSTYSKTME